MRHTHFSIGEREKRLALHTKETPIMHTPGSPIEAAQHYPQEFTEEKLRKEHDRIIVENQKKLDSIQGRLDTARRNFQSSNIVKLQTEETEFKSRIRKLCEHKTIGDSELMQQDLIENIKEGTLERTTETNTEKEHQTSLNEDVQKLAELRQTQVAIDVELRKVQQEMREFSDPEKRKKMMQQDSEELNKLIEKEKNLDIYIATEDRDIAALTKVKEDVMNNPILYINQKTITLHGIPYEFEEDKSTPATPINVDSVDKKIRVLENHKLETIQARNEIQAKKATIEASIASKYDFGKRQEDLFAKRAEIIRQQAEIQKHEHNGINPITHRENAREARRNDLIEDLGALREAKQREQDFEKSFKEASKKTPGLNRDWYRANVYDPVDANVRDIQEETKNRERTDFEAKRREFFALNGNGLIKLENELNRKHGVWINGYASASPNSGILTPITYKSPIESLRVLERSLGTQDMRSNYRFLNEVPEGRLTLFLDPSGRVKIREYSTEIQDTVIQQMADRIVKSSGGHETNREAQIRRNTERRESKESFVQGLFDSCLLKADGDPDVARNNLSYDILTKWNPAYARGRNEPINFKVIKITTGNGEPYYQIKLIPPTPTIRADAIRRASGQPPLITRLDDKTVSFGSNPELTEIDSGMNKGLLPVQVASAAGSSVGLGAPSDTPPPPSGSETPAPKPASTPPQAPKIQPSVSLIKELQGNRHDLDTKQIQVIKSIVNEKDFSNENKKIFIEILNSSECTQELTNSIKLAVNSAANNNPFNQLSHNGQEFAFGSEDVRKIEEGMADNGKCVKDFLTSNMDAAKQAEFINELSRLDAENLSKEISSVVNEYPGTKAKGVTLEFVNNEFNFKLTNPKTQSDNGDFNITKIAAEYSKNNTFAKFIELIAAYIHQFLLGVSPKEGNGITPEGKDLEKRKSVIVKEVKDTDGGYSKWDEKKSKELGDRNKLLSKQKTALKASGLTDAAKTQIATGIAVLEKEIAAETEKQKLAKEMVADMNTKTGIANGVIDSLAGGDNPLKKTKFVFDDKKWIVTLELNPKLEAIITNDSNYSDVVDIVNKLKEGSFDSLNPDKIRECFKKLQGIKLVETPPSISSAPVAQETSSESDQEKVVREEAKKEGDLDKYIEKTTEKIKELRGKMLQNSPAKTEDNRRLIDAYLRQSKILQNKLKIAKELLKKETVKSASSTKLSPADEELKTEVAEAGGLEKWVKKESQLKDKLMKEKFRLCVDENKSVRIDPDAMQLDRKIEELENRIKKAEELFGVTT